ncbi:MAG TPA: hypothetical protein VFC51_12185 [Chloroflexota bacterium]|nr:hypothetical protein [Chloroflexota bacterium]
MPAMTFPADSVEEDAPKGAATRLDRKLDERIRSAGGDDEAWRKRARPDEAGR